MSYPYGANRNLKVFPGLVAIFGKNSSGLVDQNNLAKLQSLTVDPKSTTFKIENNALLSYDGTILYLYLPYSTETEATFETVTKVEDSAFWYVNGTLQTLNFPKVETIETYAFHDSKIENVSMPLVKKIERESFYKAAIKSLDLENIESLGRSAFTYCTQLTTIVIGDKLTTLEGTYTLFAGCSVLKTVTIKTTTPPKADKYLFQASKAITDIFVPAESVDAYKAADVWKDQADKIKAIPTEAVSAPAEVALPASKKED